MRRCAGGARFAVQHSGGSGWCQVQVRPIAAACHGERNPGMHHTQQFNVFALIAFWLTKGLGLFWCRSSVYCDSVYIVRQTFMGATCPTGANSYG